MGVGVLVNTKFLAHFNRYTQLLANLPLESLD
jgi:hypothetical protein